MDNVYSTEIPGVEEMSKEAAAKSAQDAGTDKKNSANDKDAPVTVKKMKEREVYKGDLSKLDKNARRELFRQNIYPYTDKLSRKDYEAFKYELQIELLKMQNWVRETGERILILCEGTGCGGQGRHHQAHHGTPQPAWRAHRGTGKTHSARDRGNGISNAISSTCRAPARSCCSTAPGTTVPVSSV